MKPEFSFNYGERQCTFLAEDNAIYELEGGVTVTVRAKEYKGFDALEWVLYFENKSGKDSEVISDIWDCSTLLPLELAEMPKPGYRPSAGNVCVITMNGMVDGRYYWENDAKSATEYGLNYEYLDKARQKTKRFANVNGRSSDGMMPFFDVTSLGNGYITAVGWTGDWKTEFSRQENGVLMKSGLKETCFYLKHGEQIRTSSVLIMKYTKEEDKYNKFRRLIKSHFSHKSCTAAERDSIMACELWGGLPSEEMKKRVTELREHGIKFEDIWLDAGWYGNCTKCDESFSGDWSHNTGDWEVNTRVHPQELLDVAACAREMGAGMMLWLEPERAIQGTKITLQHPEWFLKRQGHTSQILNYGNEEARQYVAELLCHYAEGLKMSCYRQDFNIELTKYFAEGDRENRRGITEIKHITGMYRLWDELLAKFPGLVIDNCSSGGRRIDIETLKRSIPFFRSDYQCNFNENSEVLQAHNANISLYLPYNGCTSKTKSDAYAIRSSYSTSWGGAFYNAIFQSMDENDFAFAKRFTDEYRSIRKYFSMDFYNHGSSCLDPTAWAIWQYHDSEAQSGIVMAFRRSESPFEQVKINLKGMLKNRAYTFRNLDDGTIQSGTDLVEITLPQKRSCTILEYQLKKD